MVHILERCVVFVADAPFVALIDSLLVPVNDKTVLASGCQLVKGKEGKCLFPPVEAMTVGRRQCISKHDLAHGVWRDLKVLLNTFLHPIHVFSIAVIDDHSCRLISDALT